MTNYPWPNSVTDADRSMNSPWLRGRHGLRR